jgi:hypothetical protein
MQAGDVRQDRIVSMRFTRRAPSHALSLQFTPGLSNASFLATSEEAE